MPLGSGSGHRLDDGDPPGPAASRNDPPEVGSDMTTNSELRVPDPVREPLPVRVGSQRGDRIFAGVARGAGILIVALLAGVAVFLLAKSLPAFNGQPNAVTGSKSFVAWVAPALFGTILA